MLSEQQTPPRRQFIRIPQLEKIPLTTEPLVRTLDNDIANQATMPVPLTTVLTAIQRQSPSSAQSPIQPRLKKARKTRKKHFPLWLTVCSIITLIAVVFMTQGTGATGAWMADALRAVVGPTITAQIEAWYLDLTNTSSQVQYQMSNKHVASPWQMPTITPLPSPTRPTSSTVMPMTLNTMSPTVTPALPGEGTWTVLSHVPSPYSYLPMDARAFIRPDPTHPYAIVTMLQFDPRFTSLHIVAGTVEPGGPRGIYGPGIIPASDVKGNALVAAFNGGFKYADGQYGMMSNGTIYVPPQPGVATIAITKTGKLILGAWGVDSRLNTHNTNLVAWRQNAALLIDNGVINPLTSDGAAWGGTILNSAFTWRSAIGITAEGALIYAAGNALTALTLGQAMKAAGAVMAMQTDINPFWVRAFLYSRDHNATLNIAKLNPQMQGSGYEYLYGTQRDFFYVTSFTPTKPPSNGNSQDSSPGPSTPT